MLLNTPICDFGWKAPDFTLKDPSGDSYNMQDHLGEKGLLIAFICNHCPYVQAIGQRFAQDTKELMNAGINVLAVMSNDYRNVPSDSPANMLKFAQEYRGRFDDAAMGNPAGGHRELFAAMLQISKNGQGPREQVRLSDVR